MKKLMMLLVIAFAVPACGKKTPPPANAGDADQKAADPANPCGTPNPCATPANPCAPNPCAPQ